MKWQVVNNEWYNEIIGEKCMVMSDICMKFWSPTLLLLWIFQFILMDLRGGKNGVGLRIDNLLPFFTPLVGFWFRFGACIWFRSLHLGHQWLLGLTLTCVVSGYLMELTPLSCVLLRLRSVVLCLWLYKFVLGHHALALSFFSMVWGHLYLAFDSQVQNLASSVWIYAQSW